MFAQLQIVLSVMALSVLDPRRL